MKIEASNAALQTVREGLTNSEDVQQWDEFWAQTPVIDLGDDGDVIQARACCTFNGDVKFTAVEYHKH